MALANVIRRGNRRHTRTIAQRSIGGLSAVGLGAAVLFTGVTHHPASNPAAASGPAAGVETVTVTQSSASARLSLLVKYRILPTRKIKVLSVAYLGDSKRVLKKHSILVVFFGPGLNPPKPSVTIGYGVPLPAHSPHHFSGSLSAKIINQANKTNALGKNGSVSLSVESLTKSTTTGTKYAKAVNPSNPVLQFLPATAILSS